jgi:hypothetical protein
MAIPIQDQNSIGVFVPTTFILDVAQLQSINVTEPAFKELLVRLYENLNRMVLSLNSKTSGVYPTNQTVTGNMYFPVAASTSLVTMPNRPVTRIVINFGALPNAGTKSVAHGLTINSAVSFTNIYGTASDPVNFKYIPLPYASTTLNKNIELNVDATNVNVITGIDYSAYTLTYIVLEFLTQ